MAYKDYPHGDLNWFKHDRFGMFIHWGLYSMPARHEWIRNREFITDEAYQVYFDLFDPDLFQPEEWAKAAKKAGMKYMVITTKHHEGFCLWDSAYTDYKATNTPAKRDLLREIVDAFRAEGLKIGFYYSLLDWHHPEFPIDKFHPLRNLPEEEITAMNEKRDMKKYAQYMRDQVTELLTNYGKIDILWFDFSYPTMPDWTGYTNERGKGAEEWESEKMLALVRKLQPGIILNDRLNLPGSGDVATPEQYLPEDDFTEEEKKETPIWEGCQTFSGSWGYHRDESTWKSPEMCIRLLADHVSRGGNLLMNVGPTSRGTLDSRAMNCLDAYAEWMKYNSRAIYGCERAPYELEQPLNCRYTYNPETNRLYVHIFAWPFIGLHLPGLAGKVRYAQLLCDGSEITMVEKAHGTLDLYLPVLQPDTPVPVIELFLK